MFPLLSLSEPWKRANKDLVCLGAGGGGVGPTATCTSSGLGGEASQECQRSTGTYAPPLPLPSPTWLLNFAREHREESNVQGVVKWPGN